MSVVNKRTIVTPPVSPLSPAPVTISPAMHPAASPLAAGPMIGPSVFALGLGFAVIYLVWGSTYLAIRFAVETLPPFLMAGVRFIVAGALLYPIVRWQGAGRPSGGQWRHAAIIGGLLLVGGNGLVSWASQWVPSGVTALILATTPLWMVMLDWLVFKGRRPTGMVAAGIAVGLCGVAMLIGGTGTFTGEMHVMAVPALLAACALWALGTLWSKRRPQGTPLMLNVAMQMLCGGAMLLLIGTVSGEWAGANLGAVSFKSAMALAYLIFIGALVGFSTYVWLVRHASPAAVSSYAYVNPLVAVVLGATLGNEMIGPTTLAAMAVIIAGVVLIMRRGPRNEVGRGG